ncbi:heavy-metal-associated domain-containing protein [Streptomyces sp. NBC_01381]|uniref:heavy-metal-associated domain-containing protein n=1 Tax=unclassified Streptomyces TaxID=2593676 RepID=UPI0022582325|nr:heavy-metal-associated domain-containing protein [Streptomyces sp. NBC_01381]MCX4666210.1 heavy-metal-associated domain-containing protein [Streptomyces sp. NBC_01381]
MSAYTTTYKVDGVHSAHCRGVVSDVLGALDTVTGVHIPADGTGHVSVTTTAEPDDARIAETVEDAGYDYVGRV